MAQPVIVAMHQSDLHARKILRKHARNRPLGRIENLYQYSPAQPVLSCRTVNVDVSGTRTYRARSSSDIIEEQHRLIHEVYMKARNVTSAPSSQSRLRTPTQGSRPALRNWHAEGEATSLSRPATTSGYGSSPASPASGLKKRPKAAFPGTVKPATDCHLNQAPDHDLEVCAFSVQLIEKQVHEQWQHEQHALDEGQFVRTKKRETSNSLDPKTGSQWLTFGGGQKSSSAGVIDAFTGIKMGQEYYSIDGSTGAQVVRQARSGERIRVGTNGRVHSKDFEIILDRSSEDEQQRSLKLEVSKECDMGRVPLCWADQLTRENTMIVEASRPKQPVEPLNLCVTRPVMFEKQLTSAMHVPGFKSSGPTGSYRVNMQTKRRLGVDGKESCSPITSISIDLRQKAPLSNDCPLTIDDILESKVQRQVKRAEAKPTDRQDLPDGHHSTATCDEDKSGMQSLLKTKQMPAIQSPGTRAEASMPSVTVPQPFAGHLEKKNLMLKTRPAEEGTPQAPPAGRPPPLKPQLHRATAAGRASAKSGPGKVDPEYIQISRQLQVSSKVQEKREEPDQTATINSVSEHNKQMPITSALSGKQYALATPPDTPRPHAEGASKKKGSKPRLQYLMRSKVVPGEKYAVSIPTAGT